MSPATSVSITAVVVDLCVAVVFFWLSRAAGWRRSVVFAAIAGTAALYALMNMTASIPGLSDTTRRLAYALSFSTAAGHAILWLLYTRASEETGRLALSRLDRAAMVVLAAIAVLALVPGVLVADALTTLELPRFGVTYWTATTTPAGVFAGALITVSFLLPLGTFVARARRREPGAATVVAGFSILIACALNEVLVASGVYSFLFLADVGFGAVVVAIAVESMRRIVRDADALASLSNRLASDVLATESERDEARAALVDAERLGHEINNPLAYLRQSLRDLAQHLDGMDAPPSVREALADATEGAARIDRAVRALVGIDAAKSIPSPPRIDAEDAAPRPTSILLVDDDERVCRAIARMLRGRDVTTASSGAEALARIEEHGAFDAIVCDISMPVMDGIELAHEIAKRWPALRERMLFVTGGAPGSAEFLARDDVRWLRKPFSPDALDDALRQLGGERQRG